MKKRIILISIFLISSLILVGDAPKITVDSPGSPDVWYKGNEYPISWSVNHSITANVKIRIYSADGKTKIRDITDSTDIDENFKWKVPDDIPENCYVIRVKTIDNDYHDDSSIFSIKNKKKIKVIKMPLEPLKPDLAITNIFKEKDCGVWLTVKNTGKIKINQEVREKIEVNGVPVSQEKTHFNLDPGGEFSQEIPGLYAKFSGTTIKIFLDPTPPLDEVTKSNNTMKKTLKCIQVIKNTRKR